MQETFEENKMYLNLINDWSEEKLNEMKIFTQKTETKPENTNENRNKINVFQDRCSIEI